MASKKSVDGVLYVLPDYWHEISLDRRFGYVYHRMNSSIPGNRPTKWERRLIHNANGHDYFIMGNARHYISSFKPGIKTWNEWAEGIRRGKW